VGRKLVVSLSTRQEVIRQNKKSIAEWTCVVGAPLEALRILPSYYRYLDAL
jgi:hypothetical protein